MSWHDKPFEEVLAAFNVRPDKGLDAHQVKEMKEKYGENIYLTQKQTPAWLIFLEQFNNPIIYILIAAAILNYFFSDLKDTLVIGGVIILNAILGYVQEQRASDALKTLRQMAAPLARVIRWNSQASIREGTQQFIQTSEVVCGDIIVLESGMRVPADARLIDVHSLLVDESLLTGESFSITKKHDIVYETSSDLADRLNMVYSGSIIQKGRGLAVVTAVGNNTEIGKISKYIAEAEDTISPIQYQIEKFGKGLSIAILFCVLAIFVIGIIGGNQWVEMLMTSVALAVSAIPEGLPIAVTITLSIGVYQMAKHNAVVKKLSAVETLGSTNIICTDKTGTLTRNQMAATELFAGFEEYHISGGGYAIKGEVFDKATNKQVNYDYNKALELASIIGALCTESSISENEDNWKITGDPTECALMIAANKLGFKRNGWEVYVDIPFESENQLMAVKAKNKDKSYILVKGAPEKIITRCSNMIDSAGNHLEVKPEEITREITSLSERGLRVLSLAYTENVPEDKVVFEDLKDLSFVGFAGIEDSVRPEATIAVQECHEAGVKVVMITGDHAQTAQAVAKSIGIGREVVALSQRPENYVASSKDKPVVMLGKEIDSITDEELFERVPDIDVYARVAPHHKFRIVRQLQAHGNVVSMTGDGVNDAPALKQADIGVAMGSGTDVAKDSAHMVLMDDNFASIVQAVRRGRVILHNLQHILLYILATSFGGLLTIACSVLLGWPLPLLATQLLWVNMVTDGTSTIPLAFESQHGNVMVFSPRKKNSPLINKFILYRIVFAGILMMLGTLILYSFYLGPDLLYKTALQVNTDSFGNHFNNPIYSKAQTIAFCVLAFFQIWNVQNSRSLDRSLFFNLPYSRKSKINRIGFMQNKILLLVMILALALQVAAVQLPFFNLVFDTIPLNFTEWFLVISVTFSIIILVEIYKFIAALINKPKTA